MDDLRDLSEQELFDAHMKALALDKANPSYSGAHPDLIATRTELQRRRERRL
jgi:hypothetical protein